jgi:hypothetical protein
MDLVTHVITTECEVRIVSYEQGHVCVRISEKNPNLVNPTIFEISGEPKYIAEAFATAAAVIVELEGQSRKEPS